MAALERHFDWLCRGVDCDQAGNRRVQRLCGFGGGLCRLRNHPGCRYPSSEYARAVIVCGFVVGDPNLSLWRCNVICDWLVFDDAIYVAFVSGDCFLMVIIFKLFLHQDKELFFVKLLLLLTLFC